MKIVQLANGFEPASGGSPSAIDELGRRYARAGHDVVLVIPGDTDDRRTTRSPDGSRAVITVESPLVPGFGGRRAVVDLGAARRVLTDEDPDVVELYDKTTLARAVLSDRRRRAPVVLVSPARLGQRLGAPRWGRGRSRPEGAARRMDRWLSERVDAVVCPSAYAADEFRRSVAPAVPPPVTRIPLGVDLDTFRPGPEPASERASGMATLIHVGRLSPDKQPHVAVDALRRLRARGIPARLVVIGGGPLEEHLRRAARDLPVEFLGRVDDRAVIARHLAAADVAVATGPFEIFGMAALEALASGTPVVVPPTGALRELVPLGAGMVAAPHADGVADAVAAVLVGDRIEQRRLARVRAEELGWARTAAAFLGLHERLTRSASIRPGSGNEA